MDWAITINSELIELKILKQSLREILERQLIIEEIIEDAQLIAEEVLVNIIQHGYQNQSNIPIEIVIKISNDSLMMIFEDSSPPFNPLSQIAPPDLSVDCEERALGGLGFYLVQELSDYLDYNYYQGKNILTICIKIHQIA